MNSELFANQKQIIDILTQRGNDNFVQPRGKVNFTGNTGADDLLNDISWHPHAFVLGCVMDQQFKADRAWIIPYRFSCELKGFEFEKLLKLKQDWIRDFFVQESLHRFPNRMADCFYHAIRTIDQKYQGNASNIWADTPASATVVSRFIEFKGVGPKISAMAANRLVAKHHPPQESYTPPRTPP